MFSCFLLIILRDLLKCLLILENLGAQQLIQDQYWKNYLLDGGLSNEATIIANSEVDVDFDDNFELPPAAPCEAEVTSSLQHTTASVSDANSSAIGRHHFPHLLDGTIHKLPGRTFLAQVHPPRIDYQPTTLIELDVDVSTSEENGSAPEEKEREFHSYNPQQEDVSQKSHIVMKEASIGRDHFPHLFDGTIHKPPGGTILAQVHPPLVDCPPASVMEGNESHTPVSMEGGTILTYVRGSFQENESHIVTICGCSH